MMVVKSKAAVNRKLDAQSWGVAVGRSTEPVSLANSEQELAKRASSFPAFNAVEDLPAEAVSVGGARPFDVCSKLLLVRVA